MSRSRSTSPTDVHGKPLQYAVALGDEICHRLAEGESLARICKDEHMPKPWTVYDWLDRTPEFLTQYNRARELQADYYADEIADIADDATNDYMDLQVKSGTIRVLDKEHVQRSRLRVDTRKWIACKLKPKKYGEFSRQEMSGPDGGPIGVKSETRNELIDAVLKLVASQGDGETEKPKGKAK
jgi:hypothetical protein